MATTARPAANAKRESRQPSASRCATLQELALAFAAGLAVVAIAALDLLDRFGIDLGINHLNRLLVPQAAVPGPETWFSMITGCRWGLALAGSSLALSRFERYRFAATAARRPCLRYEVFALLTYLSGIHTLYGSLGDAQAGDRRWPALRRRRRHLADRSDAGAPHARPLWHLLIMLGCAIIAPLLCSACTRSSRH